jgi:hypothetical protein
VNKEVKIIKKNKSIKNKNDEDTNLDIHIENNNQNNIKSKKYFVQKVLN